MRQPLRLLHSCILTGLLMAIGAHSEADSLHPHAAWKQTNREIHLLAKQIQQHAPAPGTVAWIGSPLPAEEEWPDQLQAQLRLQHPGWSVRILDQNDLDPWRPERWSFVLSMTQLPEILQDAEVPSIMILDEPVLPSAYESFYRATALIKMSMEGPRILPSVVKEAAGDPNRTFNTRVERLRDENFHRRSTKRYALLWDAHGRPDPTQSGRPEMGRFTIRRIKGTSLLEVMSESDDPLVATVSANSIAEAAAITFQDEHRDLVDSSIVWIKREIKKQKERVSGLEKERFKLKGLDEVDALNLRMDMETEALTQLTQTMLRTEMALYELREKHTGEASDADETDRTPTNRQTVLGQPEKSADPNESREQMSDMQPEVERLLEKQRATHKLLDTRIRRLAKMRREKRKHTTQLEIVERDLHSAVKVLQDTQALLEAARMDAAHDTSMLKLVERASLPETPRRRLVKGVTGVLLRVERQTGIEYDWIPRR